MSINPEFKMLAACIAVCMIIVAVVQFGSGGKSEPVVLNPALTEMREQIQKDRELIDQKIQELEEQGIDTNQVPERRRSGSGIYY